MAEVKKTAAAKASAAKAAEVKSEEAKAEAVEAKEASKTAKKTTAKKTTAKTAKKTTAKEAVEKETAGKATGRKAAAKSVVHVQFAGKSYTTEDWVQSAKDVWEYDLNRKPEDFKSVELYVKPEEQKVYYVVNGEVSGDFNI